MKIMTKDEIDALLKTDLSKPLKEEEKNLQKNFLWKIEWTNKRRLNRSRKTSSRRRKFN